MWGVSGMFAHGEGWEKHDSGDYLPLNAPLHSELLPGRTPLPTSRRGYLPNFTTMMVAGHSKDYHRDNRRALARKHKAYLAKKEREAQEQLAQIDAGHVAMLRDLAATHGRDVRNDRLRRSGAPPTMTQKEKVVVPKTSARGKRMI